MKKFWETDKVMDAIIEQKPTAEYGYIRNGIKNYSCVVIVDGIEEIVEFEIPSSIESVMPDESIPALTLIHFIKKQK